MLSTPFKRNVHEPWRSKIGGHQQNKYQLHVKRLAVGVAFLLSSGITIVAEAMEAPGAPGNSSSWTSGAKQGIGTSTTPTSKVWYTLGNGILNEVYHPRIDLPNVEDLQFIVSDGVSFVDLERDATDHQVQLLNSQALTYRQVNTKVNRYRIIKTYVTDVDRPTLLIETRFEVLSGGPYQLYVLYNPSLNGSGMEEPT